VPDLACPGVNRDGSVWNLAYPGVGGEIPVIEGNVPAFDRELLERFRDFPVRFRESEL